MSALWTALLEPITAGGLCLLGEVPFSVQRVEPLAEDFKDDSKLFFFFLKHRLVIKENQLY